MIPDSVRQLVADYLGKKLDEITLESRLTELGLDSLDRASLQLDFETEFDIEITDAEMQKLFTVADIVRFIENEVAAKA